jgi:hypothetical protein
MTDYFLAGLLENRPNREAEQTDRARCRTARFAIRKALDDTDRQLLLDILGVGWDDANPGPSYLAQQRGASIPPAEPEPQPDTKVEMKVCSRCQETQPITEFPKDRATRDGRNFQCKTCRRGHPSSAWRPARNVNVPEKKGCSSCRVVKPAAAFASDRTRSSGLSATCRECRSIALRAYRARLRFDAPVSTT